MTSCKRNFSLDACDADKVDLVGNAGNEPLECEVGHERDGAPFVERAQVGEVGAREATDISETRRRLYIAAGASSGLE